MHRSRAYGGIAGGTGDDLARSDWRRVTDAPDEAGESGFAEVPV